MPTGSLKIKDNINGIQFIKISGSFTKETIPGFSETCSSIGKNKSLKALIFDFQDIEKIDTSAFACMINFVNEHISKEIKIGIIHLSESEKVFIDIHKINNLIYIYPDKKTAIKNIL